MRINSQVLDMFGITELDYKIYCKMYGKNSTSPITKQYFFEQLASGNLVMDEESGRIIRREEKRNDRNAD